LRLDPARIARASDHSERKPCRSEVSRRIGAGNAAQQKISGREYQLTRMAGFLAAMWDKALPDEFLQTKDGRDAGAEVLEIDDPCPQGRSSLLEESTGIRRSGPRRHHAMTRRKAQTCSRTLLDHAAE
jgi:hypothetical protein